MRGSGAQHLQGALTTMRWFLPWLPVSSAGDTCSHGFIQSLCLADMPLLRTWEWPLATLTRILMGSACSSAALELLALRLGCG